MSETIDKPNKQMMAHLPSAWRLAWRRKRARWRGVKLADDTVLFDRVELLRFPDLIHIGRKVVIKVRAYKFAPAMLAPGSISAIERQLGSIRLYIAAVI